MLISRPKASNVNAYEPVASTRVGAVKEYVYVVAAAASLLTVTDRGRLSRSSPMPAQSVDPRIDEEREQEAVEGTAHDHAGEERCDELEPVHRAPAGLTARTYPVGGTGSRCGSDQRAVMR